MQKSIEDYCNNGVSLIPKSEADKEYFKSINYSEYIKILKELCYRLNIRPAGYEISSLNKTDEGYYIDFKSELDSNKFINYVNRNNNLPFKAETAGKPVGLSALKLIKRLK